MAEKKSGTLSMGPNTHPVPLKMFQLNRERLSNALTNNPRTPKNSIVLLQGGDNISFYDTDVDYIFRQESFFMWAFGVLEPGCFGTIDVTTGMSSLFIPRLPEEYSVWMGPLLSLTDFKIKYGVDSVKYVDEMANVLPKDKILLLMSGVNSDSNLEIKPAKFNGIENFKINIEVLYPTIAELRVIKTELELSVLRYVTRISSEAHKKVMLTTKPGCTEYQSESTFLAEVYNKGGCRHVSYICICGSGVNSAVLHYGHAAAPNDKVLRDGEMCLFDMGANYFGYAADITCSFPVNGKFTADQKLIYEAVLSANRAVMNTARAGLSWIDMHLLASKTLLEKLIDGGLLKGNVEEMMKENLFAIFQPHGLGHLIGLDVHDVGGYLEGQPLRPLTPGVNKLRMARVLKAGMVVTIEPGCYFIKPLLEKARNDTKLSQFLVEDVLKRFENFGGVRIEDDVIITENGVENMTKVPRTVEEIEDWMANGKCH